MQCDNVFFNYINYDLNFIDCQFYYNYKATIFDVIHSPTKITSYLDFRNILIKDLNLYSYKSEYEKNKIGLEKPFLSFSNLKDYRIFLFHGSFDFYINNKTNNIYLTPKLPNETYLEFIKATEYQAKFILQKKIDTIINHRRFLSIKNTFNRYYDLNLLNTQIDRKCDLNIISLVSFIYFSNYENLMYFNNNFVFVNYINNLNSFNVDILKNSVKKAHDFLELDIIHDYNTIGKYEYDEIHISFSSANININSFKNNFFGQFPYFNYLQN